MQRRILAYVWTLLPRISLGCMTRVLPLSFAHAKCVAGQHFSDLVIEAKERLKRG
jgi:hypothetical protein